MRSAILSLLVIVCVIALCLASDAGHGAHDTHAAPADAHGDSHGTSGGHGDTHGDAAHGAAKGASDKLTSFGMLAVIVPMLTSAILSQ